MTRSQRLWLGLTKTEIVITVRVLSVCAAVTLKAEDYLWSTNNSAITITKYTSWVPGPVTIPSTITGLPVTRIGYQAFFLHTNVTSLTIPDSVVDIEDEAFHWCQGMRSLIIGQGVTNLGDFAFSETWSLDSVSLPNSLARIGAGAFSGSGLYDITVPDSVVTIGSNAFQNCYWITSAIIGKGVATIGRYAFGMGQQGGIGLVSAYFSGNAPAADSTVFYSQPTTVYYLPGAVGWGPTFAGRPTALWVRPSPVILTVGTNFGIKGAHFGFNISWATNTSVVVEASTAPANSTWIPVSTNTLTGGWSYFSDPEGTSYAARFYRVRSL